MVTRKLALATIVLALSGCAQIQNVKPGTSLSAVEQQFGKPNVSCPLPGGATRAIWSQQPYGDTAWAADVTPAGEVGELQQVLTDKSFEQLSDNTIWTPEKVLCAFGPPEKIDEVGMPSVRRTVWSYRYRQAGTWHSLMYVFFDSEGKRVTEHYAGPDPMYMYDYSGDRH